VRRVAGQRSRGLGHGDRLLHGRPGKKQNKVQRAAGEVELRAPTSTFAGLPALRGACRSCGQAPRAWQSILRWLRGRSAGALPTARRWPRMWRVPRITFPSTPSRELAGEAGRSWRGTRRLAPADSGFTCSCGWTLLFYFLSCALKNRIDRKRISEGLVCKASRFWVSAGRRRSRSRWSDGRVYAAVRPVSSGGDQ